MKIFSWVHRKFHNKDESSEKMKMIKAEHGRGALLEQIALGDVMDDWGQGILAIGTFGYDPSPNSFNQQVHFHLFENDEELEILENEGAKEDGVKVENEISDDRGKHNPLVLNASKDGFSNEDIVCDHDHNVTKSEITMLAMDDLENLRCDKREFYEKKERITLADLFLAESDEYLQHTKFDKDQGEVLNEPKSMKKAEGNVYSKLKLPFTKKFIPLTKEYSNSSSHPRGIKKIHKMMTTMLKKKIHPEGESKKQMKKENQLIKYGGKGVIEIASLLQTQASTVCP